MDFLRDYLIARAQEPSTWVSLGVFFTGIGWNIAPEHWQLIALVGMGFGGLAGSLIRERQKMTTAEVKDVAKEAIDETVKPTAMKTPDL